MTQSSNDAKTAVDVTISVQLVHSVPANAMLVVTYPSEVSVSSGTLGAELVSPTANPTLAINLISSERKIQLTDVFPSGANAGDTYEFILKNITNTETAGSTSSFIVTTFVSSAGSYRIDRVISGLTMSAN